MRSSNSSAPSGRRLTRRESQKDDGGHVLHDEDSHCDAAVQRRRLSFVFEHLDDEDGAGKTQCKGDQQGPREIDTGQEGGAQTGPARGWPPPGPERPTSMCKLATAQTCGRAMVRRLSFRPTRNSNRVMPRSDNFCRGLSTGGSMQIEQEARGEEADQRRQPDGPGQQTQHECQGDRSDVSDGDGDQLGIHGLLM